jgi:hypothetical protein
MREKLSRMFGKAGLLELLSRIRVRVKLPDKREVGSSTLPRPMIQNLFAIETLDERILHGLSGPDELKMDAVTFLAPAAFAVRHGGRIAGVYLN